MALFIRFFVIGFGFFLGCFAAAATSFFAWIPATALPAQGNDLQWAIVWWSILVATGVIASFAFLPSMIGILMAEAFAWRSVVLYAVAGGIGGLFYGLSLPLSVGADHANRTIEITTAAGIAAGLVYWLVAGRRAGAWRGPTTKAGENI